MNRSPNYTVPKIFIFKRSRISWMAKASMWSHQCLIALTISMKINNNIISGFIILQSNCRTTITK